MSRDVILNKSTVIDRCIERIRAEYAGSPDSLLNFTKQDSIILNLLRACEASIDIAMHVIATEHAGIPQSSRNAFEILAQRNIVSPQIASAMSAMVGFRNVAVHDYQSLNIDVVRAIVERHLGDYHAFVREVMHHLDLSGCP